jgi:hypothetical protein
MMPHLHQLAIDEPQFVRTRSNDKTNSKSARWRSRSGSAFAAADEVARVERAQNVRKTLAQQRFGRLSGASRNVAIWLGAIFMRL